jgi:hypothetical protein
MIPLWLNVFRLYVKTRVPPYRPTFQRLTPVSRPRISLSNLSSKESAILRLPMYRLIELCDVSDNGSWGREFLVETQELQQAVACHHGGGPLKDAFPGL